MGLFKKKITAAELGEYLANAVAVNIHIPVNEIALIEYLVENTPLDEESARFEMICLMAVIFDNTILYNVSDINQREDLLRSFYYSLIDILGRWNGDSDGTEKTITSRMKKYYEALETGRLASGTPAIARAFMDVCIGKEKGGLDDYVYLSAHTMALMTTYTELAHKLINQYKLV
jgi:hypothetical protein